MKQPSYFSGLVCIFVGGAMTSNYLLLGLMLIGLGIIAVGESTL